MAAGGGLPLRASPGASGASSATHPASPPAGTHTHTHTQEALDAKAGQDQVRLVQQQAAALGAAVAGMADNLALRPDVGDALRSAANFSGGGGASSGPAASKFRCLTCDQTIQPPKSGGAEGRSARGSFLPRLESMPAKEAGAHGHPTGPGLSAAELRQGKEERMAGLAVTGGARSLKASEVEDYMVGGVGMGTGTGGRDASPAGRAVERARAARTAVGGPAVGKPAGHNKTPVFV